MAKDKTKIYIGVNRKNALYLDTWKYVKTKDCSYWYCALNKYYLKYLLLPNSSNIGHLTLDLSVSKTLNNNNAIPQTQIVNANLLKRLQSDLKYVLNFDMIQNFNEWIISKDETFVDMIISKEVVASLYHIIEYSSIARRRVDTTYKHQGTLYVHSSKDRNKSSWTLIAYDKVKEGAHKDVDIVKMKGLKEGQCCLRLELKTKGYSLKKLLKEYKQCKNILVNKYYDYIFLCKNDYKYTLGYKTIEKPSKLALNDEMMKYTSSTSSIEYRSDFKQIRSISNEHLTLNLNVKHTNDKKNLFTHILETEFQSHLLFNILNELHLLNKRILTKAELFDFIDSSSIFKSKTKKENAKKIVRILNGERVRTKFSDKVKTCYKKKLLSAGVHYVYVKHKIPKISLIDLFEAIYKTGNLILE